MPSKKITCPIESGKIYHIYNRGNNFQKVFLEPSDYLLFLEKMTFYLIDYCEIYSYVLLPNHYHILLRVSDQHKGKNFSHQFSKLILSYTNRINWREHRKGNLFGRYFRRILVDDENYLKRLVYYINTNPENHEIVKDFKIYRYSSYQALISNNPTKLSRSKVIDWFGNLKEFIDYHNYFHDMNSIKKYLLEDDF